METDTYNLKTAHKTGGIFCISYRFLHGYIQDNLWCNYGRVPTDMFDVGSCGPHIFIVGM